MSICPKNKSSKGSGHIFIGIFSDEITFFIIIFKNLSYY